MNRYDRKETGKRLRGLRLRKRLTIPKAAGEMQIGSHYLNDIEGGRCGASLDKFILFSEYYKVSLEWILFGEQRGRRNPIIHEEKPEDETSEIMDETQAVTTPEPEKQTIPPVKPPALL